MKHFLKGMIASGLLLSTLTAVNVNAHDHLPDVPNGAEAVSFMGQPIAENYSQSERMLALYEKAKADYEANPDDVMAHIWYGRRTAYLGRYRAAIDVFTKAIEKFPDDERLYRHRGHRYISIRDLDRSLADYQMAAMLMAYKDNAIEPDGLPNAQNIPLSTTQGNIWYHYGLAHYLKQEWEPAFRAFSNGRKINNNDDNLVSVTHWRYMILRRQGKQEEANAVLDVIRPDMTIIENQSYYDLCKLYAGMIGVEDLGEINAEDPSNASIAYGLANWYYYNGDKTKAKSLLMDIMKGSSKMSFGYIAAEADLAKADWSE